MTDRNLDNYEITQWDPTTASQPSSVPQTSTENEKQNSQIGFYDTSQPNDAAGSWYDLSRQEETEWSTNTDPPSTAPWPSYENYQQPTNFSTYNPTQSRQSYNPPRASQPVYDTNATKSSDVDTRNYPEPRTYQPQVTNYQPTMTSSHQQLPNEYTTRSTNIHNNPLMDDDEDESEEALVSRMQRQNLNVNNLPQKRYVLAKSALSKLEKDLDEAGEMFQSPELLKIARHAALGLIDASTEGQVLDDALKSIAESSSLSAFADSFTPKPKPNTYAVDMIEEFVNAVSFDPGEYHVQSSEIVDYFRSQSFSKTDISKMVATIMAKAVSEENFKYAGARFCNNLCQLANMGKEFRGELLVKLQKEYKSVNELISQPNVQWKDVTSFIMLLAEMYMHLQINNQPIIVLGKYLVQILLNLLQTDLQTNFYFVVKVMKLIGALLDSNSSTKKELNTLYNHLDERWKGTETEFFKKNQFVYDNIVKLRGGNWGRRPSANEAKSDILNQPETNDNFYMNEDVYFTADGKPYTLADAEFQKDRDNDADYDNNFNPDEFVTDDEELFEENLNEYDADYEEFLKESGQC